MTGRERFQAAVEGRAVAWAPRVWERLPELVRQPAADWWRDATAGRRLLLDAAGIAGADALFVEAVPGPRAGGDDALDDLATSDDTRAVGALIGQLSAPFAVIAALPRASDLLRDFGGSDPECAEDALTDLARTLLEAGADALAVPSAASRVAAIGAFYGRPVLDLESVPVVGEDGAWPAIGAGVVTTAGDASLYWDADALRRAGAGRP